MKKKSIRGKKLLKRKALREINYLLELAFNAARKDNIQQARKYVEHAIRFSMKTNIRIPADKKRMICKKCHVPLIPGKTSSIRLHRRGKRSYITIRCLECGWVRRLEYRKG